MYSFFKILKEEKILKIQNNFKGGKEVWKTIKYEKKIRKILREHKSKLPVELIEKILLYNRQHPVAKLVKVVMNAFKDRYGLNRYCYPDMIRRHAYMDYCPEYEIDYVYFI